MACLNTTAYRVYSLYGIQRAIEYQRCLLVVDGEGGSTCIEEVDTGVRIEGQFIRRLTATKGSSAKGRASGSARIYPVCIPMRRFLHLFEGRISPLLVNVHISGTSYRLQAPQLTTCRTRVFDEEITKAQNRRLFGE